MKNITIIFISLLSFFTNYAQFDTTNCHVEIVDTIKYVINKSNTPTALSINTINDTTTTQTDDGYTGFGQLFEAPDTVNLNGFCFYGFMYSGAADSLLARVYNTNASGLLDSIIDSAWVQVPLKSNYNGNLYSDNIRICFDFNTTHQIIGNYVISLSNSSASDMYITRNINGGQEDLSYTYYTWTSNSLYDGWYQNYNTFGNDWDFDIIIEPIVSYFINSQHLTTQNSNCFGDTLLVSSNLTYNDSLFSHRMYNPNYSTYTNSSNFSYDYENNATTTTDTTHVFTIPGSFNSSFIGNTNLSGWTFNNYSTNCTYNATAWGFEIDLGTDTSLCAGSINLSGGQFFDGYLWNTTDTTDILVVNVDSLAIGIYQFSLRTDFQGCYSYDTIDISVGDLPINLGSDTSICLNQQLELTTNITGDHYWNTGQLTGTIIVGPFNQPNTLEYTVEVEADGCFGIDTINVTIDNCLSIEQKENLFSIYPNPAQNELTIDSKHLNSYTITIIDVNGRAVFKNETNNFSNKVDLSDLDNGTYVVQLSTINQNIKHLLQIIK